MSGRWAISGAPEIDLKEAEAIHIASHAIIEDDIPPFDPDAFQGHQHIPDGHGEENTQEELPPGALADALAPLLVVGMGLVAKRFGEHWGLDESEAASLAGPLGEVLEVTGLQLNTPEARLGAVALMVFGPKALLHIKLSKEAAEPVQEAA